ncbi:MAG: T9SS type A sorting domain-containing protein [Rhodothermia bacterium]
MERYIVRVVLPSLIVLGCIAEAQAQDPGWTLHQVASGAAKPALALTSDGIPHIAYMLEANAGYVHHAIWNDETAAFEISEVVTGYFYGPLAIAVDSDGRSHINYHDHTSQDQQHVFQTDQGWVNEPIRSPGHDGWDNSIVVDASGGIHTSSVDPSGTGVEYARRMTSSWEVEAVGSGAVNYGFGTSLALDPDGVPHIAYFDDGNMDLMLASRTGAWSITAVDTDGDVGRFASLRIDANGTKHIAYFRDVGNGSGLIEHAESDGSNWIFGTVDKLDDVITSTARNITSLDLDELGNPHVTYGDRKVVRYAYRDGDQWNRETIADVRGTPTEFGQLTSLELDGDGVAHVAYYEVVSGGPQPGAIMYARREQGAVTASEVPVLPGSGLAGPDTPGSDVAGSGLNVHLYPNPAASLTHIEYEIDRRTYVEVVVYDLHGREVRTLVESEQAPGHHRVSFTGDAFSAGRYIVSVTAGARRATRMLVLTSTHD